MGRRRVVTPPLRVRLLELFRAKPILITGNLASATGLRGLRLRRAPCHAVSARPCTAAPGFGSREHAKPCPDPDPGPQRSRAPPPSIAHLRRFARQTFVIAGGATVSLASQCLFRPMTPRVPGALPLDRVTSLFRAGCAAWDPESSPREGCAVERQGEHAFDQVAHDLLFPHPDRAPSCSWRTAARCFPTSSRVREGATAVGPGVASRRHHFISSTPSSIVVAQIPSTRVGKRMRATRSCLPRPAAIRNRALRGPLATLT